MYISSGQLSLRMSSNKLASEFDLTDEKQQQEYLNTLHTEYQFQCFGEKEADGCQRLGDFYEAVRKDFVKARQVHEPNCTERNHPKSCYRSGIYYLAGKGGAKADFEKAYDYFHKACASGHGPSCVNCGIFHHGYKFKDPAIKQDPEAAVDFFEKGCAGGDSGSCNYVTTYYLTGRYGVPKDFERAAKFAEKACHLSDIRGCHNLSLMYRNGEGVEKNAELAEEYKKRAEKIMQEYKEHTQTIQFGK